MTKTREPFTTPVGRLVQGDPFVPQTKDQQGNLRVIKSGPNVGQPAPQFFIAVAFPKMDPANPTATNAEFNAFYAQLDKVARAEWPSLFPTPGGPCVNPLFTFKVKDGDGMDRNGKSNAGKEGFAGHWVVSFASAYAPKIVRPTSPGVWETLTDHASVKRGYYVRVNGTISGNDSPNTPGLYVNLDMIELVAYGPEIVSGPDAATAFAAPAALPPGASAVPPAASPAMPGATPGAPPAPLAVPGAGATASPAASPVPASPPAYTGHMTPPLPGASTAAAPPPPVSAPPATGSPTSPAMTAAAAGATYESFIAAGWTHDQLVANGYIAA